MRAGEIVKIQFGEYFPVSESRVKFQLENSSPKAITFAATSSKSKDRKLIRHFIVNEHKSEFDLVPDSEGLQAFNEIDVSVPEDVHLQISVYLKSTPALEDSPINIDAVDGSL